MDLEVLRKFWRDILYSLLIVLLVFVQAGMQGQIDAAGRARQLEVVFLDVGQGDAFLISTPDQYTLLVDSGENRGVLELLSAKLVGRELSAVMVSHPHEDHLGLMPDIIEQFSPEVAFINDFSSNSKSYQNTLSSLKKRGTNRVDLTQGEAVRLGCCVVLEILWPDREIFAKSKDPNLWSTSFRLRYGDFTMVVGGDLYKEQEEQITRQLLIPGGQVLKVNHHGSKTSSSPKFLETFAGGSAVIQVGINTYGHPAKQVLVDLEANLLTVYTNLERGNITLYSDGFSYSIDTDK